MRSLQKMVKTMFVPRLEVEHAQEVPELTAVVYYPEYKVEAPHECTGGNTGTDGAFNSKIGADADGYSSPEDIGTETVRGSPRARIVIDRDLVENLRMIKSEEEIQLIKRVLSGEIWPMRFCKSTQNPAARKMKSPQGHPLKRRWL